jgi:hypothetical protein
MKVTATPKMTIYTHILLFWRIKLSQAIAEQGEEVGKRREGGGVVCGLEVVLNSSNFSTFVPIYKKKRDDCK